MITRHSYCDGKIIFVRIILYIKSDFVEEQHLHLSWLCWQNFTQVHKCWCDPPPTCSIPSCSPPPRPFCQTLARPTLELPPSRWRRIVATSWTLSRCIACRMPTENDNMMRKQAHFLSRNKQTLNQFQKDRTTPWSAMAHLSGSGRRIDFGYQREFQWQMIS